MAEVDTADIHVSTRGRDSHGRDTSRRDTPGTSGRDTRQSRDKATDKNIPPKNSKHDCGGAASLQDESTTNDDDIPKHVFYMNVDPMSFPPPDDATIAAACSAKPSKKRRPRYAAPLQAAPPPGFHQPLTLQPLAYGYPMPTLSQQIPEKKPRNYMFFNVVVTVLCCVVLGFVGVLRSRETKMAVEDGEMVKAHAASLRARRWGLLALCTGLVINTAVFTALYVWFYHPHEMADGDR